MHVIVHLANWSTTKCCTVSILCFSARQIVFLPTESACEGAGSQLA